MGFFRRAKTDASKPQRSQHVVQMRRDVRYGQVGVTAQRHLGCHAVVLNESLHG